MHRKIACLVAAVAVGGSVLAYAGPAAAVGSLAVANNEVIAVAAISNTAVSKVSVPAAKSTGDATIVVARNHADATAVACANCRSVASAVEMVFAKSAAVVRAYNVAVARAYGCGACSQMASAFQWVVIGGPASLPTDMNPVLTNARNELSSLGAKLTPARMDEIAGKITAALNAALHPPAGTAQLATAQTAAQPASFTVHRDIKTN